MEVALLRGLPAAADLSLKGRDIMVEKRIPTLRRLIERLHEIFESDSVNVEQVEGVMRAYKSNPAEWLKFAKFAKHRYTRNLVDSGNGKFNLMILCWGEGHGSSIHDHANAHCFMKMLAGELCEVRYDWPSTSSDDSDDSEGGTPVMKEISRGVAKTDEVLYINDSLGLHRVENLSRSERAVSLHLYSPPYNKCKIFNQQTGHASESKVTFWSIYGEKQNTEKMLLELEDD